MYSMSLNALLRRLSKRCPCTSEMAVPLNVGGPMLTSCTTARQLNTTSVHTSCNVHDTLSVWLALGTPKTR